MADYARGNPARWWSSRSVGAAHRSPAAMFISPFRRMLSVGALAVLLLLITGVWYITNPKRIGRMSEVLLSNVLGGPVTVRSGHLSLSGTLQLSGVELGAGEGRETLPLFSADSIEARFDWLSLLSGQLRATQLTAVRPTLYLIEDRATDRWNYERLRGERAPESQASAEAPVRPAALPVIILREARVEWAELNAGQLKRNGAAIVDGQLAPDAVVPAMYRFQMNQRLDIATGLPVIPARGGGAGGGGGAVVTGTWEVAANRFSAVTSNIPLSEQLHRSMPRQVRNWWDEHKLTGSLAQFRLSFDGDDGLVLGADLNRISMVQTLQPVPEGPSYTLNFRNVRGTLTFGITRPIVRVSNLRGEVLGFSFTAEGNFRGVSAESPFELTLKFPNANVTGEYPPLFLAFPSAQDLVQRIRPQGRFDVELSLVRRSWNGAVFPAGKVVCRDARMRFVHFPFPLDHVNGEIVFNEEQVDFRNVKAEAEEASVTLNGTIGTVHENPSCDFTVSSSNCIFDDRMGACLPEKYRKVWDAFAIRATGGFVCKVQHSRSRNDEHHVSVDVNVTDGRGYYRSVPLVFSHATGKIKFEGQEARLQNLQLTTGKDGSGKVRLDGVVTYAGESLDDLRPVIEVTADVPIDAGLLGAMPDPVGHLVSGLELGGRVTFVGAASRHEDGRPKFVGALELREGHVATAERHVDLQHLTATARIDDEKLTLAAVDGDIGPYVQAHASGVIDLAAHRGVVRLAAVAHDQPIPAEPLALAPQAVRETWASLKPSGTIDADLTASVLLNFAGAAGSAATSRPATPTTKPAEPVALDQYVLHVHPKGITLAAANWPDKITDIRGIITVSPGEIDCDEMTATSGPMTLAGKGTYHRESGKVTASGKARSGELPEKWYAWLPEAISSFLRSQKVAGAVVIDLGELKREGADQPWEFKGETTFEKVSTQGVWAFAADRLAVKAARVRKDDGTMGLTGTLTGVNFAISGRTLETLAAKIESDETKKTLRFSEIAGTVASGPLQGSIDVWLEAPPVSPHYEAKLTLTDAPLTALLLGPKATEEEKKRVGTGKVTASLAVQETLGTGGAPAERTGRGELIVRDGTVYDVPLAMGLMQIASLRLPVAHAFDRASMSYYLRDNKVTFERILLESEGINLAGLGTLSLKDKGLDLTLLTESPNDLKLPFISEFIQRTRNELFQLSVTGTVDNPKVIPVPLTSIAETLKALLPPRGGGAKERGGN